MKQFVKISCFSGQDKDVKLNTNTVNNLEQLWVYSNGDELTIYGSELKRIKHVYNDWFTNELDSRIAVTKTLEEAMQVGDKLLDARGKFAFIRVK